MTPEDHKKYSELIAHLRVCLDNEVPVLNKLTTTVALNVAVPDIERADFADIPFATRLLDVEEGMRCMLALHRLDELSAARKATTDAQQALRDFLFNHRDTHLDTVARAAIVYPKKENS